MADNVIEQPVQETQVAQPDHSAELAAQMHIALNGGMPSSEAIEPGDVAPVVEGAPITATSADATATQAGTVADPFGIFKEKFGIDTPEAAIKQFEELLAFKAQPRATEFVVPDDETGAMVRAIAAGKREEVWKILDHDIKIDRLLTAEVTKETAPDIVKMGMQLKYKDLSPEEINYRYKKQFSVPAEPVQGDDEEDGVYQQRVSAWQEISTDRQMELMIEAKLARPELQNAKTKLVFPEIESSVDEGYVQYQKMLENNAAEDQKTKAAYKLLTPKDAETKLAFKDEANKIAFEFQFEPDGELFNKAVEIASNADMYWQTFTNPDGTPNRKLFLESIMYAIDKGKVLMSAMNQSKNAAIKATLPDNSQGGLIRQIPQTQEPNELEASMRAALKGFGGF